MVEPEPFAAEAEVRRPQSTDNTNFVSPFRWADIDDDDDLPEGFFEDFWSKDPYEALMEKRAKEQGNKQPKTSSVSSEISSEIS